MYVMGIVNMEQRLFFRCPLWIEIFLSLLLRKLYRRLDCLYCVQSSFENNIGGWIVGLVSFMDCAQSV